MACSCQFAHYVDTVIADADGHYEEGEKRMKLLAEFHEGHRDWTLAADTCAPNHAAHHKRPHTHRIRVSASDARRGYGGRSAPKAVGLYNIILVSNRNASKLESHSFVKLIGKGTAWFECTQSECGTVRPSLCRRYLKLARFFETRDDPMSEEKRKG